MDNKSEYMQAHPITTSKEAPSEAYRVYKTEPKRKLLKKIAVGVVAAAGLAAAVGYSTTIDNKAYEDAIMNNPSHQEPGLIDKSQLNNFQIIDNATENNNP